MPCAFVIEHARRWTKSFCDSPRTLVRDALGRAFAAQSPAVRFLQLQNSCKRGPDEAPGLFYKLVSPVTSPSSTSYRRSGRHSFVPRGGGLPQQWASISIRQPKTPSKLLARNTLRSHCAEATAPRRVGELLCHCGRRLTCSRREEDTRRMPQWGDGYRLSRLAGPCGNGCTIEPPLTTGISCLTRDDSRRRMTSGSGI